MASPKRPSKKAAVPVGQVPVVRVLCELLGFQRASVKDTQIFLETMHAWRKSSTTSDGERIGNLLNWKDPRVQTELSAMSTRFLENEENAQRFWSPSRSWWQEGDLKFPEDKIRIRELLTQLFWRQNKYAHMNMQYGHRITELRDPKPAMPNVTPNGLDRSKILTPTPSTASTPQVTTPTEAGAPVPAFPRVAGPNGAAVPLPLPPTERTAPSSSASAKDPAARDQAPVQAPAQAQAQAQEPNLPVRTSEGSALPSQPARSGVEPDNIVELSDDSDEAEVSDTTGWLPRHARPRRRNSGKPRKKRQLNEAETLRRTQRKRVKTVDPKYATLEELDNILRNTERDKSSDDDNNGNEQEHTAAPAGSGEGTRNTLPQEPSATRPFVAPTAPMITHEKPKPQSSPQKTSPASKKTGKIAKLRAKPPIQSSSSSASRSTKTKHSPRTSNNAASRSPPSTTTSQATPRSNASRTLNKPSLTNPPQHSSPSDPRSNSEGLNRSALTATTQTFQQDATDQRVSEETSIAAGRAVLDGPISGAIPQATFDSLSDSSRANLSRLTEDNQARADMSKELDNFLASKASRSTSMSSFVVPQMSDDPFSRLERNHQRDLDTRSVTSTTETCLPVVPRLQTQLPSHGANITGTGLAASPSPIVQPQVAQESPSTISAPAVETSKPRAMAPITLWIVTHDPMYEEELWEDGKFLNTTTSEFFDSIAQVTQRGNFARVKLTLCTPISRIKVTVRRDDETSWNVGKKSIVDGLQRTMREMRGRKDDADVSDFRILIEPLFERVSSSGGGVADDYQATIDYFGLK